MKYTKLLSLSLVVFTLFGCNQTSTTSQIGETVEAANPPQQAEDKSSKEFSSNQKNVIKKQIGSRFDCNGDGKANGARIDTNGDGIPDECIESDEKTKSVIDETSYNSVLKSLNSLTKGCKKTEKTKGVRYYSICKKGGEVVEASEYHSEAGAGLTFWFHNGKVVAVQRPHSEETFVYDNNGKLNSKFIYPRKVKSISNQDRKDAELLYNAYERIFAVFNKDSSGKTIATPKQNSSSQYGTLEELNAKIKKRNGRIIGSASCDGDGKENDVRVDYNGDGMPDECVTANLKLHPSIEEETLETVSVTLNYLEKGCNTASKSQGNYDYYICKKDGKIVKAIKSQKESAASVMYWFENGKPLAIQRIDSNYKNDFFVYYPDGKLSSIFSIVDPRNDISKRILNFNNQQIQEAGNLVNSYQDIFQVFGVN